MEIIREKINEAGTKQQSTSLERVRVVTNPQRA